MCAYHILFICSSIKKYLGCFYLVVQIILLWICMYKYIFVTLLSIILKYTQKWNYWMDYCYLNFNVHTYKHRILLRYTLVFSRFWTLACISYKLKDDIRAAGGQTTYWSTGALGKKIAWKWRDLSYAQFWLCHWLEAWPWVNHLNTLDLLGHLQNEGLGLDNF